MLHYRYQPLEHDQSIRLLILHPSLDDSKPITCTIQHLQLSHQALKYEALSYTWGNTSRTKAIKFHDADKELIVGENCYDALRRLRLGHMDRLLWIDAICINQEDLAERAHQVRIMADIFSCASGVVVFLGEMVTESSALFAELAAVDRHLSLGTYDSRNPPSDSVVQQLEALYELPWFKRVWILQEVYAKSSVIFMYGSAITSFEALQKLHFGYHRKQAVTDTDWPLPLEWIDDQPEQVSVPQINLWKLLFASRNCLATDPRDRVFALKSLTGSGQSEFNALINYDQSLEECFTQVAILLLPVLGPRLLLANRHPHKLEMPSWVPDWSQNLPLMLEEYSTIAPANEGNYEMRSFPSKCGKTSLELLVTGCRYAEIISRSRMFSFNGSKDTETQMRNLYHSLPNLRGFSGTERLHDDKTTLANLGQDIVNAMLLIDGLLLHLYLNRHFTGLPIQIFNGPHKGEFVKDFEMALQQCSIVLLNNHDLAIVPGCVEEGDVVSILSGTISACVLRPTGKGYWSLVSGDCFIFTDDFRPEGLPSEFECDKYITCNHEKAEVIQIR